MDTLQDMRDRLLGIDLMAEMTAEGASADENLGKVQGEIRLLLVDALDVFAKVVATRLILDGTPQDQALPDAWEQIKKSFMLYSERKKNGEGTSN